MIKRTYTEPGRAYAFFYCSASKEEIEREIPDARLRSEAPNELELRLIDKIDSDLFSNDSELRELAKMAKAQDNNYCIEATLPYSTNLKTANALVNIQNSLYMSPLQTKFNRGEDKFIGAIIYKDTFGYEFME